MIVNVDLEKHNIRKLWNFGYPKYTERFLNHYLEYVAPKGECIAIEEDGELISTLSLYEQTLLLNGRKFPIYHIKDIVTLPDYRRRGYMDTLMKDALAQSDANSLFTCIDAFNPKLFERYGFETIYYHKHYILRKEDVKDVRALRVDEYASAEELFLVYQEFVKRFDGHFKRDIPYFEELLKLKDNGSLQLCVYRNVANRIEGYCFYTVEQGEVVTQEVVYLGSTQLKYMIKYSLFHYEKVHVWVSQQERLERVFPLNIPKKSGYLMVRANHLNLYNKLANTKFQNVKEIFRSSKKPLFYNSYR